jgi:hypothetical protein
MEGRAGTVLLHRLARKLGFNGISHRSLEHASPLLHAPLLSAEPSARVADVLPNRGPAASR